MQYYKVRHLNAYLLQALGLEEYGDFYFLKGVFVGPQEAIKSIAAQLLSGHTMSLQNDEEDIFCYTFNNSNIRNRIFKVDNYYCLTSVDYNNIFATIKNKRELYEFIKKRINIPIIEEWSSIIWDNLLKDNDLHLVKTIGKVNSQEKLYFLEDNFLLENKIKKIIYDNINLCKKIAQEQL